MEAGKEIGAERRMGIYFYFDISRDNVVFPYMGEPEETTNYGGHSKILPFGTPAEVKEEVLKSIETLGQYNGYIIGPANSITSDVPMENIEALIKSIAEFNR